MGTSQPATSQPATASAVCIDLQQRLADAAQRTQAISFCDKRRGRVLIRYAGNTLRDNQRRLSPEGGLYVAAIANNRLIFNEQYNTCNDKRAGESLLRDIQGLAPGTFVIVAAHYDASKRFTELAQQALHAIGAKAGLQGQADRTSYLCLGIVGLPAGQAIELVGHDELVHRGELADRHTPLAESPVNPTVMPIPDGLSQRTFELAGHNYGRPITLWLYRPRNWDKASETLFVIHGTGRDGAAHLDDFVKAADRGRFLIVAPEFSPEAWPSGPGFHWGGLPRWGQDFWPVTSIERIFDYLKACTGNMAASYKIIGHSAGGQFVHRLVLFCPDARFSLASAHGGWRRAQPRHHVQRCSPVSVCDKQPNHE